MELLVYFEIVVFIPTYFYFNKNVIKHTENKLDLASRIAVNLRIKLNALCKIGIYQAK